MSLLIAEGHRLTPETEFKPSHPDVFSTCVAADVVLQLARQADRLGQVQQLRVDLNIQTGGRVPDHDARVPVRVSFAGQVVVPAGVDLRTIAHDAVFANLSEAGYLNLGLLGNVVVDMDDLTSQSPHLNKTTNDGNFADSAVVYGHYIAPPHGIQGTAAGLIFGGQIDRLLADLSKQYSWLRRDGKVHVTTVNTTSGPIIEDIYLSVAHGSDAPRDFREIIKVAIASEFDDKHGISDSTIAVNAGGNFDVYFVAADAGVSKAKDDTVITGGVGQLGIGTDRVWGKCIHKASAVALPWAMKLAQAVCTATGAGYATVSAYSRYGQGDLEISLSDIDPRHAALMGRVNRGLAAVPRSRGEILRALGLEVDLSFYTAYNDVYRNGGFHDLAKPWKKADADLSNLIRQHVFPNEV